MFPLLRTKTSIPPTRPRLVERDRLLARVGEGMQRALTLLVAPAGSGKTTLAAAWARQAGIPVAWLTLEPGDRPRRRFLTYLIQALQTIHPQAGQTSLALLQAAPARGRPDAALVGLVNDLAGIPGEFALVLDDYHTVDSPETGEMVQFLLDHRPANFHLALTARAAPHLALARLRALDQVTEIGMEDLRFTPPEIHAFLEASLGRPIDPGTLARLSQASEGWAVGLHLSAAALSHRPDWSAPPGQVRIFEYLAEEVLRREPPQVQAFLTATALLDRFCVPLCEFVCSDAGMGDGVPPGAQVADLLGYIEQSSLFLVALDSPPTWFRYHALFADFLRSRADPAWSAAVYRSASRWCERSGLPEEALHYAIHAGDLDRAADLFETRYRAMLQRGEQAALSEHLAAFPPEWFARRPRLWLARGWTAIIQMNSSEAEECAVQALALIPPGPQGDPLRGEAQALRSMSAIFGGKTAALADIEQAGALLEEGDHFLHSLLNFNLGLHAVMQGETARAVDAFSETLRLARFVDNPLVAVVAWTQLGETRQMRGAFGLAERAFQQVIRHARATLGERTLLLGMPFVSYAELLREQNRLEEAAQFARQGIDYCQVWSPVASLDGWICLARLAAGQGRWDEAATHLETAIQIAENSLSVVDDTFVAVQMARLLLLKGDLARAARWIQAYELETACETGYYHLREIASLTLLRSRVLAHAGTTDLPTADPRLALALAGEIAALAAEAERRERITSLIEALLLHAGALHAGQAGPDSVGRSLGRALTLGAQSGYVRIFADEGPRLLDLLERCRPDISAPRGYVEEIIQVLRQERDRSPVGTPIPGPSLSPGEGRRSSTPAPLAGAGPGANGFPLTRRELDILGHMAAGRTNQEIAAACVLTLNTVKKHVANILAKLGVANRTQAVLLARHQGWTRQAEHNLKPTKE